MNAPASPVASSPAPSAAAGDDTEIPLEIEDYSCANTFEQIVDDVERYLRHVFQTRPELHRLVYLRARPRALVVATPAPPQVKAMEGSLHSMGSSSTSLELTEEDHGEDADSLMSALSSPSSESGEHPPLVISRAFPLRRPRRRGLAVESTDDKNSDAPVDDIVVEIHVDDTTHPIGRQYQLPLFFLVRSVQREPSYLPTESTFYLSILATAVGNAFCGGQQYVHCSSRVVESDTAALATPFLWHRGCAPCFVPVGDCYQEIFQGLAPPIAVPLSETASPARQSPAPAAPPQTSHVRDSSSSGLVAMLVGNPVLTSSFSGLALAKIPNNCQYVSDFLDLFQLHIGQRSHVQASEFDGICVSLWKRFSLSVPWRFLPCVSTETSKSAGATAMAPGPSASASPSSNVEPPHLHERRVTEGPTWPRILEHENDLQRGVSGPFTYPIGTSTPPVEEVRFSFGWSQLREMEAQESSRRSFLNPFSSATTVAGQAVQRRACVVVQPRVREESKYSHYICDKVVKLTDAIFNDVYSLVTVGTSVSATDPTSGLTPEELRKLTTQVLAVTDNGISVAAQSRLLEQFSRAPETTSSTVQDALADLLRNAAAGPLAGSDNNSGAGGVFTGKDLRRGYFPGSFLSRFAHRCGEFVERPEDVFELWKACVSWMKTRLDQGGREAVPQILRCLALPESDVAVDLGQTLLVQKLQLLAYCLRTMLLTPREKEKHVADLKAQETTRASSQGRPLDGWDEDDPTENFSGNTQPALAPARAGNTTSPSSSPPVQALLESAFDAAASPTLTLITNGEPLVVPPSVPSPPMTTDVLLQRAKELNDLGSGRGADLTRTWLQSDALYNDMCLFLSVNKAEQGRVVRFPDFIQWHSPRDFKAVPLSASRDVRADDNAYLSDRMQKRDDGMSHVWWALWDRATPRSLEEIASHLFQEHEQIALVFRWLTSAVTLPTLLLEVVNASLANAAHRLLSHRHVVGGTAVDITSTAGPAAVVATTTGIPGLRAYLQSKCTTFTSNVEGAAAVFDAANAAAEVAHGVMDAEIETVRTLYATAISGLGEMESAVCSAIAVENLLGLYPDGSEAATLVRHVSTPVAQSSSSQALALQAGTTTFAVWASSLQQRFVLPQDRTEREMVARFTCVAERPLNTTGCFQQLVVQKRPDVLRLSLALTHEVL